MLSILKPLFIGSLSLTNLNNTEYVKYHNSLNLSYQLGLNQFIDREYTNEFHVNNSHFIVTNLSQRELFDEESYIVNPSIDWRDNHKVTTVKNQGSCGDCWAFSSVGAVESAWAIKNNVLFNLSQQELLDCSSMNKGCKGGSMDLAFKYIMNNGLCTNLSYPYIAEREFCQKNDCEPVIQIKGYRDVTQDNEKALARAVSKQPISVAIQANKRSFQLYQSGIYNDPDCGTELDHGVLLVGYGTDIDFNMDYWIIKNSWGKEWGENGYIKIQRNIDDKRGLCGIAMQPSYPIV